MASEYPDVFEWLTYEPMQWGATPGGPAKFVNLGGSEGIYCTYCGASCGPGIGARSESHIRSHEYDALMQKVIRENNFANARSEIMALRKELHIPEPPSTYEPYQLNPEPTT